MKQLNRCSKQRYRERKRKASKQELINRVNSIVLDKTYFNLDFEKKLLLSKGLNFAPTPKWTTTTEDLEWESLQSHNRRVEWADIFKDNERDFQALPLKLKIPKFFRFPKEQLSEEVVVYTDLTEAKLRNLDTQVNEMYRKKNNLNHDQRKALTDWGLWYAIMK